MFGVVTLFVDAYVLFGVNAVEIVNARSLVIDEVRTAKEAALDYYVFVRNAYLQIALKEPERVKLIDTSGPVERTQERVREIIVPYLHSRGHLAMNYVR